MLLKGKEPWWFGRSTSYMGWRQGEGQMKPLQGGERCVKLAGQLQHQRRRAGARREGSALMS